MEKKERNRATSKESVGRFLCRGTELKGGKKKKKNKKIKRRKKRNEERNKRRRNVSKVVEIIFFLFLSTCQACITVVASNKIVRPRGRSEKPTKGTILGRRESS